MGFLTELTDQLNLRWAWEKVRNEARPGDIWFDVVELASFELDLERNLESISREFKRGYYRLNPIKPLAFPKHPSKDGTPRVRQTFQVCIKDQVAWTALVNIVGPYVDSQMPAWSYGNRLFRSIWIDEDESGLKHRRIGRYRHSSGRFYLPFRQSWPVFRRHVYLTTRAMIGGMRKLPELDESDEDELEMQLRLKEEFRCPFVHEEYWKSKKPSHVPEHLFWCCIDLEKFYPSVRLDVVLTNIVECAPSIWQEELEKMLHSMLKFKLDLGNWTDSELRQIGLRENRKFFSHIPTGLYIAGFLANAALLGVDRKVEDFISQRNVAHFRFVDDHIILAYSFKDLTEWVQTYDSILNELNTGAHINPEKIEPSQLTKYLFEKKKRRNLITKKQLETDAEKACQLNPEFPSPLMTKTIALVSGIAKIDFNLLDAAELDAITEQLEHLLLVQIPEEEIPEKTRLSFAASRLTKLAEQKLANNLELTNLLTKKDLLIKNNLDNPDQLHEEKSFAKKIELVENEIQSELKRSKGETQRVFHLLRKVLQDRPDRVRLWTRALLMCRYTGIENGLSNLFEDIRNTLRDNPLAADYLSVNLLTLLSEQVIAAAKVTNDAETVQWRKQANMRFLKDVSNLIPPMASSIGGAALVEYSHHLFYYGLYCASIVADTNLVSRSDGSDIVNTNQPGQNKFLPTTPSHRSVDWVWWATRRTLYELSPRASNFIVKLAQKLEQHDCALLLWRFFPHDVTIEFIEKVQSVHLNLSDGWWFDVLRAHQKRGVEISKGFKNSIRSLSRAKNALLLKRKNTISLYEWCDWINNDSRVSPGDPRHGEWTALEIVKQVADIISQQPSMIEYITQKNIGSFHCVHPANFRLPKEWVLEERLTWESWKNITKKKKVSAVGKKFIIHDEKYMPIKGGISLFAEVNHSRGLGLLLYGLLNKCFDLPSIWNGPGHKDVLSMLPRLLLDKMTCSSWTLGILQGCLMPRAMENIKLKRNPDLYPLDDDMIHDPIYFLYASDVVNAINIAQNVLSNYHLVTFGGYSRQLTPVSILQLTQPVWKDVFRQNKKARD
ncbi:MAG: hypothetical protein HQ551_02220 [Desulfobacteraceae bacterium]|nr:hypothetical protein [Desulfobacteraceae bacterium]